MSPETFLLIFLAFGLGGILKGATGTGAPFLAVPIMSLLVNVPFAVAVFLLPNIASNTLQVIRYRHDFPPGRFALKFAGAAMLGAGIGTVLLSKVDGAILSKILAVIVFAYIWFRLKNPEWHLPMALAHKLAVPIGTVGGIFQGAVGLSAPVSVTFMNAVPLKRRQFISAMSLYFLAMALAQFPAQIALGIMTMERFGYSLVAIAPLVLSMPIGDALGRRISKRTFDRVILTILTLLACRLIL
ncbi:hypothetical protein BXY66_0375 [Shimia isoporae]|uniref:Probable membrane transporter protein n=1 Tax=Shimia isoporae TaxID=647720 RepID=A0A4R1NSU4_9RHOB|nr:sulfite exporter TauE/SafE family protein [Shimia isoporae]TCL08338.1 hypothetical protein BXY66_0375 [Shimia isoporae]